jgi:eukaryotic-like serine/threonine-protein kinase
VSGVGILRLEPHPDLTIIPRADWPAGLRQAHDDTWVAALSNRSVRSCSLLVDQAMVELVGRLSDTPDLARAVRDYASEHGLDPDDVIDLAVPTLQRLVDLGLLVAADSRSASGADGPAPRTGTPTWPAGQVRGDWTVVRCVRRLDDTAIYEVVRHDGMPGAMKVVHEAGSWQSRALSNELFVLARIDCPRVPRVLDSEIDADQPALVLQWRDGEQIWAVAQKLRSGRGPVDRLALLRLAAATARAYADLHASGVLHGDVQPRNLLATMGEEPEVSIVDLGFADLLDPALRERRHPRGGVEGFQAPELIGEQGTVWRPTEASEQYAVGCLLYELVTGAFPYDRTVGAEEFRAQLGRARPRGFTEVGTRGWAELEAILLKAIATDPRERYPSVAALAEALQAHLERVAGGSGPADSGPLAARVADVNEAELAKLTPPIAGVNYGAAGVAYALYRRAHADRDGLLLATAQAWAVAARRIADRPTAFHNPLLGIDPTTVGSAGLYHAPLGAHLVEMLTARARDDAWVAPLERLLGSLGATADHADVVSGTAGQLLGAAHALAAVRGVRHRVVGQLLTAGDGLLTSLAHLPLDVRAEVPGLGSAYLGVAHGWGGIVYAGLVWTRLTGEGVPGWARTLLGQLVDATTDAGDGAVCWPRLAGGAPATAWPGWCHGSAGHALLHAEAARQLGSGYLTLAAAAARHASRSRAANVSLCCGQVGIGYAQLALYRRTGEEEWLRRARQALDRCSANPGDPVLPHSLYKGRLGREVLRADLQEPSESLFPLFDVDEPRFPL